MLLILDNYDSFTYNLVQRFGELGMVPEVFRNDRVTVADALDRGPEAVVISPGPCTPSQAGIAVDLIRGAAARGVPVLGVCLGHQAIGEAFGARVVRCSRIMHGKTSPVEHTGDPLFTGLDSPLEAMRYHSLVIDPASVPPELEIIAWSGDRPRGEEIMALRHRTLPIRGVQFHPESVGTAAGTVLLKNFLRLAVTGA